MGGGGANGRARRHEARRRADGVVRTRDRAENDSECAVRAALRIQGALAELNRDNAGLGEPEIVAHIDLESGAVVDAPGEIFGDAPNSAARVQTLADPGTMLITARVQRQVAGLFVAEDCGLH
jgi:class 3 adenylate cyclase